MSTYSTAHPPLHRPARRNRPILVLPTTPGEQTHAVDILIRAALTNKDVPLTSDLQTMLSTLPHDAGLEVATVLVTLAGGAVSDREEWIALLQKHIKGATQTVTC